MRGVLAAVCALVVVACSRDEPSASEQASAASARLAEQEQDAPPEVAEPPSSEVAQDEVRQRTAVSKLELLHERIDHADTAEERRETLQALTEAFEGLPGEGKFVLAKQDLAYRAARLALESEEAALAKRWAERGLELSREVDVGRANLLLALADAERALGNDEREREVLMQALTVNQKILKEELRDP